MGYRQDNSSSGTGNPAGLPETASKVDTDQQVGRSQTGYSSPGSREAIPPSASDAPALGPLISSNRPPEYEHLLGLRETSIRRCQWLERQAAWEGRRTDPAVRMEIEDLHKEIKRLRHLLDGYDTQLDKYEEIPDTGYKSEVDLTPAMKLKHLKKIAKAAGVAVEDIRIIAIRRGSVVYEVEMPIAGAARLVALHQLKHPQLVEDGITKVVVVEDGKSLSREEAKQFIEALAFEVNDLRGDKPSEASLFHDNPTFIPLRITLDEKA